MMNQRAVFDALDAYEGRVNRLQAERDAARVMAKAERARANRMRTATLWVVAGLVAVLALLLWRIA